MHRQRLNIIIALIIVLLGLTACSKDDDAYSPSSGSGQADRQVEDTTERWEVTGILSPNGLGDLGYNDKIFLGLCNMRDSLKCHVETYAPTGNADAEKAINKWMSLESSKNIHRLLVLCESSYTDLVKKNGWQNSENKDILLIDDNDTTLNIYTRAMLLYDACNVVGRLCSYVSKKTGKRTALLLANDEDWSISDGAAGFLDGAAAEGVDVDKYYVYDDVSRGYNMPDSVYHLCYQIAPTTGFIMPLAGASSNGVYRYARDDRDDQLWTCTVDDYNFATPYYSCFGVQKDTDAMLMDFVYLWKNGKEQPLHALGGIKEDYTYVVISTFAQEKFELTTDILIDVLSKCSNLEHERYAGYNFVSHEDIFKEIHHEEFE